MNYCLTKVPTTGRIAWIALRDSRMRRAPILHLTRLALKAPGNCEKEMRALVTINEIKNRPLTLLVLAINVQRGIRIIVIDSIFATPFSDVFRLKVNREISS